MTYYAVIDTNVIVSALLKPNSVPGQVFNEALYGCITPIINDDILSEYHDVLARAKFNFPVDAVNTFFTEIITRAVYVDRYPTDEYLPDPDDAVFYEVVMEVRDANDAYLVTGNTKHFPKKPFIVTPKEMMDIINKTKNL